MRARELLAPLLLATGCASQDGGEAPPNPPQAVDAPAPAPSQQVEAERAEADGADDELGLAEYERLLAEKEDRLRAVGVLVAVREQPRLDSRFAPPPPVGGVPADEDLGARASKSKRASSGAGAGATGSAQARPAAPPAPKRPTTTTARADAKPAPAPASRPEAAGDASFAAEEEGGPGRCQTICDLSAATCDLEGKICDLAQRHPGDARYADLCRRADDDCRLAADACQRCSP